MKKLTDQIEQCLAQTQCTECCYAGCRPYAEAIASGEADHNRCRPGGERVMQKLAKLLGKEEMPLHQVPELPQLAVIDEEACIGCTLCIQACPTDAIIGAAKMKHTVLESDCTGCKLCIDPCPVDCISLKSGGQASSDERDTRVQQLVLAKQERANRTLDEGLEALEERVEATVSVQKEELSPEIQDKINAAREAARKKWSVKKAETPKILQKK